MITAFGRSLLSSFGVVTATLLLACAGKVSAADYPLFVVGHAHDVSSGELLYSEFHYCSDDAQRCAVRYLDPAQAEIAIKQIDYSMSAFAPLLNLHDLRSGEQQAFSESNRDTLVVDAGFDNYVRSRWQDLVGGESVSFSFRPLSLGRKLPMKAERSEAECVDEQLCLTVSINSWLLGLVAPDIELVYERDSQRLLRFTGVSNLPAADGGSQTVDIRYEYAETGAQIP